jgi:hypothetical protein|nr:C25 family cysteine peptidase [Candidatus Krumholzibacteria bacterium]
MMFWRRGSTYLVTMILLVLLSCTVALAQSTGPEQPPVRLLPQGQEPLVRQKDADSAGMILELEVPVLEVKDTRLGGQDYQSLTLPGAAMAGTTGQPALPVVSRFVAIPNGMTLEVVDLANQTTILDGSFRPEPAQGLKARTDESIVLDRAYYDGRKALAADSGLRVTIGQPGLIRGQRVVSVAFHPVQWTPGSGVVTAAQRMTAELRFVPSADGNNAEKAGRPVPESFLSFFNNEVLGSDKSAFDEGTLGTWLMIYPSVSGVQTAITPLADWRTRQGYNVIMVSTSVTGTSNSAIKNYIQNQYDNLEIPLEFVTLVGDATGSLTLASWRENQSSYSGEGDHEYTRLEGNDVLADIHLGRLSVTSVSELETVVDKIVNYEMTPSVGIDDGWFTRAALTGDPSSSGYSTIWVNQWVKEQLEELNYTQIDTIWGGNFTVEMMSKINQGLSIFTYRGYWNMSGMNTGHIASLSNGPELPFALVLTCDTGSFWSDTTCRSEAFLRAPNGGGVASIGTATTGTHTRYNNCMFQGVAEGVLNSGDPRVGPGLTRGKLDMYRNYFGAEPSTVTIWSTWNNLMGDPATPIWTAYPEPLTVDYPASVTAGANVLPVTVLDQMGQPVAGARVAIYMKDVIQKNAVTGQDGRVLMPLEGLIDGEMLVTVTGNNLYPHLGGVNVGDLALAVNYQDQILIDDGTGNSLGNGDGLASPGETVDIDLQLVNAGTGGAADVQATATAIHDPSVTVVNGQAGFGFLNVGASAWGNQSLTLSVDPAAVGGTEAQVELTILTGGETFVASLPMTIHGPAAEVVSVSVEGDGLLDPGQSDNLRLVLNNAGNLPTTGVTGVLTSHSQWVDVSDPDGTFGGIAVGASGDNNADPFTVSVTGDCYPGHLASFSLDLVFAEGGTALVEFSLPVGQASSTDPVGPDHYGYYAIDNTDVGYIGAPVYDWVEIDPGLGGAGTFLGLTDYDRYDDDTRTISLPFSFDYYGQNFDEISICSNGWIAMGQTYLRHYRNWTIPSPGGPDNMIAVFWDDLYQVSGTGGVYYWHDVANHRFIVEWSRVRNYYNNVTETFQVMLYDPAYEAGDTGDGLIVAQYHTVNQSDWENGYATAGIQNEDRDDGVLYTYWNEYPGGGAPLESGRAIAYRTVLAQAQGQIKGEVTNASAGGQPIDGATVSIVGSSRIFSTAADGGYQGGVPVGTYDVAVSHPSFAPDTTYAVVIMEDLELTVDFSLTDIAGPHFTMVDMPGNSEDTAGPYVVEVEVGDFSGLDEVHFYYTSSATGGPFELPLTLHPGGTLAAAIPGQPLDTRVQYWLTGADVLGFTSTEPANAPATVHSFVVTAVSEIYATDMETDSGWIGGLGTDTATTGIWERVDPNGVFDNSVEVSPEDDHTVAGTHCWITGNDPVGSNQGANDVDGGLTTLETPSFNVAGISGLQVSYHRWYTNDTGQNPGSDFWRVQVSGGDGNWVNLEQTNTSERSWVAQSFLVEDFITLGSQVMFRFLADDAGYGSVIEAGVDDFVLMGYNLPGDTAGPDIALTSFTGGQNVLNGTTQPITWTHSDDIGVVNVEIRLSRDSGATFDEVVASGPFNQTFAWTVPMGYAANCRLKVVAIDAAGHSSESMSGADFTIDSQTPVGDLPVNRLSLAQNAPNPFNPRTEIKFSLPSAQKVELKIYNVEGRLVKTLVNGRQDAGTHTQIWSGQDDRGGRVASGLYFYRLTTDSGVLTRKMTLVK